MSMLVCSTCWTRRCNSSPFPSTLYFPEELGRVSRQFLSSVQPKRRFADPSLSFPSQSQAFWRHRLRCSFLVAGHFFAVSLKLFALLRYSSVPFLAQPLPQP